MHSQKDGSELKKTLIEEREKQKIHDVHLVTGSKKNYLVFTFFANFQVFKQILTRLNYADGGTESITGPINKLANRLSFTIDSYFDKKKFLCQTSF